MFTEMTNSMSYFAGMRVIENPHLPTWQDVPNRKHKKKSWQINKVYHERIQKKWNKRFGTHEERVIIMLGDKVVVSPANYDFLKRSM